MLRRRSPPPPGVLHPSLQAPAVRFESADREHRALSPREREILILRVGRERERECLCILEWESHAVVPHAAPASFNLVASGLWFYGYNELATMVRRSSPHVLRSTEEYRV